MKFAVIDLGTNTFNLSIGSWVDDKLHYLHSEKEGVAIGMGGINEQRISEEAIERALACLNRFARRCKEFEVKEIKAIGTSAIRDAKNKEEFISSVQSQTGIRVEVVQGIREAELISKGIHYTCEFSTPSMIMDIGGGSTEFIYVENGLISKAISLDIGVSRIYQLFQLNDPLSSENIQELESYFESNANGFFDQIKCNTLVGASGSFETFYELVHHRKFPSGFDTQLLNIVEFQQQLQAIILSTQEERDKNQFIIPIRKKMAPIAAVKTRWVLKKLSIQDLVISPCSLKEGVFVESKDNIK